MRQLLLDDAAANGARYALRAPDDMRSWRVAALRAYLACDDAEREDYAVRPDDPLRHQTLRELLRHPEQTLNAPVQRGEAPVYRM